MKKIKIISSDLNGTLVVQHTMSDIIRHYIGDKQYQKAKDTFRSRLEGRLSMADVFKILGPLTRGLTLRQAIDYTIEHMTYINGFHEFLNFLNKKNIPLIINSTVYSVTLYAIEAQVGPDKFYGCICNRLKFGIDGKPEKEIPETELKEYVHEYFMVGGLPTDRLYDDIRATGDMELIVSREEDKTAHLIDYLNKHFPDIKLHETAHIGDTMGDSRILHDIAESGGVAIGFNYNQRLKDYLEHLRDDSLMPGEVFLIDPKGDDSDLRNVIDILRKFT